MRLLPTFKLRFFEKKEKNLILYSGLYNICWSKIYNFVFSSVDLVGEMQFAFVCFLVGHSLEAFEHWKKLVSLLCSCDDAVSKRREAYDEFLTAVEAQLIEIPQDFLVDIVASNNFVYHSLRVLFRNIQMNDLVDDRLKTKAKRFQDRLTDKFQWDFSDLDQEDEDDAPVVVQI